MPRGDAPPERVRAAALTLFHQNGVAGTSLQMIADALGVTKAAIYYRYKTRDDIVRAVLTPAFAGLEELLDCSEERDEAARAGFVIDGLARQAVENRELYAVVLRDVTAAQLQYEPERPGGTFSRLRDVLCGPDPTASARVRVSIFLSGLVGPPVDPGMSDLDDEELESAIAAAGRALLTTTKHRA